jgi:hypothetical protein
MIACNGEGIEWDYILYQNELLSHVRVHLKQRNGIGDRGGLFWVNRDPQDLGRIWVSAPDRKTRIEVPAVRADYAGDLTLNQHRAIVAHHERTLCKLVDVDGLLRTRGAMLVEIERLRNGRTSNRRLARFF